MQRRFLQGGGQNSDLERADDLVLVGRNEVERSLVGEDVHEEVSGLLVVAPQHVGLEVDAGVEGELHQLLDSGGSNHDPPHIFQERGYHQGEAGAHGVPRQHYLARLDSLLFQIRCRSDYVHQQCCLRPPPKSTIRVPHVPVCTAGALR